MDEPRPDARRGESRHRSKSQLPSITARSHAPRSLPTGFQDRAVIADGGSPQRRSKRRQGAPPAVPARSARRAPLDDVDSVLTVLKTRNSLAAFGSRLPDHIKVFDDSDVKRRQVADRCAARWRIVVRLQARDRDEPAGVALAIDPACHPSRRQRQHNAHRRDPLRSRGRHRICRNRAHDRGTEGGAAHRGAVLPPVRC